MPLDLSKKETGLAAGVAVAIALSAASLAKGGDETTTKVDATDRAELDRTVPKVPPDAAPSEWVTDDYSVAVKRVRDKDPSAVDLLSAPVPVGAEVSTGVSLDRGARLVGGVEMFGEADGSFAILGSECVDRETSTWCEVRARNTGAKTVRLSAFVHFEVAR